MKHYRTIVVALIAVCESAIAGPTPAIVRGSCPPLAGTPSPVSLSGVIKWEEIFDSTTVPSDWRIVDNDGSGAAWAFRQRVAFTSGDTTLPEAGASFWFSGFTNANPVGLIDEYIITPRLPLIDPGDTLHFSAGAIGGSFHDSLRVFVSTTDSALGSFTTQIGYFRVPGPPGGWTRFSFDLSAFAGSRVFIAVNYFIVDGGPTGTHSDNIWVDHFILEGLATDVREQWSTPSVPVLQQNYPNPFNPATIVGFRIQNAELTILKVYDLLGREIATLVNEVKDPGTYTVQWDASGVSSGVYFCRLRAGDFVQTKRMMVVR